MYMLLVSSDVHATIKVAIYSLITITNAYKDDGKTPVSSNNIQKKMQRALLYYSEKMHSK